MVTQFDLELVQLGVKTAFLHSNLEEKIYMTLPNGFKTSENQPLDIYFAGGPISWKSILQSTVALSTIEAEYMAITEVVKEAIWLQDNPKLPLLGSNDNEEEEENRWWWKWKKVLDVEEAKDQVLFSLPMILTNVSWVQKSMAALSTLLEDFFCMTLMMLQDDHQRRKKLEKFPDPQILHLSKLNSDHRPIFACSARPVARSSNTKPFCFLVHLLTNNMFDYFVFSTLEIS
ncbi:hypothetical protein WN944_001549 [Citrus x changshan-huyou]|uniref:Uncharacterized protein n=1 Tax=Citrus x changshan-huyou TaxID=2935761 RepID=A0AAP0QRH5_9ROSI